MAANIGDDDREWTLEQWTEFFRFKKERDSPSDVRNALLVIAALITTATYQAVLSPPGGLWQETMEDETGRDTYGRVYITKKGHTAGRSVLGTNIGNDFDVSFAIFLGANAAGFYGSLFVINLLTKRFPLRLELLSVMVVLAISYQSAMWSIIPVENVRYIFTAGTVLLVIGTPFAAKMVREKRTQGHDIFGC